MEIFTDLGKLPFGCGVPESFVFSCVGAPSEILFSNQVCCFRVLCSIVQDWLGDTVLIILLTHTSPLRLCTHRNSYSHKWKQRDEANINSTPTPPSFSHTSVKMNNSTTSLRFSATHTHTCTHTPEEQIVKLNLSRSYSHSSSTTHHSQGRQAKRVKERYMLSEMGNKGVKMRSGGCDNDKGHQWEEGEDDRKVSRLLILHTRRQASGGQHTCMAACSSSQHTGQQGGNGNKGVKEKIRWSNCDKGVKGTTERRRVQRGRKETRCETCRCQGTLWCIFGTCTHSGTFGVGKQAKPPWT